MKHKGSAPTQCNQPTTDLALTAARNKCLEGSAEQADQHNAVKIPVYIFKMDCEEELMVPDKYCAYRDQFIKIFSQAQSMWDGHLGSI